MVGIGLLIKSKLEQLRKGRVFGKPTGKLEGKVHNVVLHKKAAGAKARPGTRGTATLQAPKFGKIAGRTAIGKKLGAQLMPKARPGKVGKPLMHGDFVPNFFRKGMYLEFEMNGEKGKGRVRDKGPKGVQVISDTGKVLNLFHHEIKGRVIEEKNKKKK